jgi:hypothetical protein
VSIFKVYYEASVGAAYIKAEDIGDAIEKLEASTRNVDTEDVRFDEWEPEVFDVNTDDIVELGGEDLETAEEIMFEELP